MSQNSASPAEQAAQQELTQFLQVEQQRAQLQAQVHEFTGRCWDKCMTGKLGNKLDRSEESCLANCVDRFFDVRMVLLQRVQQMQEQ